MKEVWRFVNSESSSNENSFDVEEVQEIKYDEPNNNEEDEDNELTREIPIDVL